MAYGDNSTLYLPGLVAGSSLAAKQFYVVKAASTAGEVVPVTATTDQAAGVIQNDPADTEHASVAAIGVAKVLSGTSNITFGSLVGFNTTGQAVVRSGDNSMIIGQALEASSASGDIVTVLLTGPSRR